MGRGDLRIYLGAAPGVGKTYAMLNEGLRRLSRGTDVVVGVVETHGRAHTLEQLEGLEIIPRRIVQYRGTTLDEMDVDAVVVRKPDVVLVDELAHTNAPGSRHEKRWQDIEELLDAGVDVISTVNIQHLEGLNDVVEGITGIRQAETVPDAWVRSADQIELVDMTPEAIRRRMAHGNIYPAERIDAALGNYFREGNLSALRELALLWLADRVDEALTEYRARHGIDQPWETRERVVVALTGAPGGDDLVRRAARMATRTQSDLVGVHVRSDDGVRSGPEGHLDRHRSLLAQLGGRYLEVSGGDVGGALLDAARSEGATQLVLGASRRSRVTELVGGSIVNRVLRGAGPIDVHVISTAAHEHTHLVPVLKGRRSTLPPRRRLLGWVLAVLAPMALAFLLTPQRDALELSSVLLLFLLVVVAVAVIGGGGPALLTAVSSSLYANWFFFPPLHTWSINERDNVLALCVFIVVGVVVSSFVSLVARRSSEANRSRAEAETLARLAAAGAELDPLKTLVEHLRDTFQLAAVSVLVREGPSTWRVEASTGDRPPSAPSEGTETVTIGEGLVLALRGSAIAAEDRHIMRAFANQLAAVIASRRLARQAEIADQLGQADELRNALLAAVSHDLRTPLASIKASASSLLATDVEWSPDAIASFATEIVEETDRLTGLVENLLDMSRLRAGAVVVRRLAVGAEEIVPAALESLGDVARRRAIDLEVPETLPRVDTDPALVERALVNLVANAIAWSPPDTPIRIEAGAVGSDLHIRVVDRGPGVPVVDRERIFQPFQRLGDRSNGAGVGLGLAVARGFVQAVGGDLSADDTPGGGTTMVLTLPLRARVAPVVSEPA
jgi:two-component system sensor histidine kinase KdpD